VFSNRPVFVYGDNVEASKKTTTAGRDMVKKVNGKDEYRALGYAVDGSVFPNPSFHMIMRVMLQKIRCGLKNHGMVQK